MADKSPNTLEANHNNSKYGTTLGTHTGCGSPNGFEKPHQTSETGKRSIRQETQNHLNTSRFLATDAIAELVSDFMDSSSAVLRPSARLAKLPFTKPPQGREKVWGSWWLFYLLSSPNPLKRQNEQRNDKTRQKKKRFRN